MRWMTMACLRPRLRQRLSGGHPRRKSNFFQIVFTNISQYWANFRRGRKRRSASGVDFTMSNSGGGKSRLELPELGERYAPGPEAPSTPQGPCHDQEPFREGPLIFSE